MKLSLTLLLLFITATLSAQVYDVIQLKNGTLYKGTLAEYIPDKHAVIKLIDDRLITIIADSIYSLTVDDKVIVKKNFDMKSKGYYNNTGFGPQFGKSTNNQTIASFAINTVNGYRLNGHHAGIGFGLENHVGSWYAPIYADYSYQFFKTNFKPLIGVNAGFLMPFSTETDRYYGYDYEKGTFIGGRIGFAAYTNAHFAFMVNLTYRYIHLSDAKISERSFMGDFTTRIGSADLNRFGVAIGFVIN